MRLPDSIDPTRFDEEYRLDAPVWRSAIAELCAQHGLAADQISAFTDGSNLVAAVNERFVVKIFPPFHRHQWESERRVLPALHGRLTIQTPAMIAQGVRDDGWPYLIIEKLPGVPVEACWSVLERAGKARLLEQIGAAMASAHAIGVGELSSLAPEWSSFIREQAARCKARHSALGMPQWLVDGIDERVRDVAALECAPGERAILTGEYTPFNLLAQRDAGGWDLTGMFDFGDAMLGPREYDLLGPSVFSCEGDAALVAALFRGYYGTERAWDHPTRMRLLTLTLLHRYASFDKQIKIPGWRDRARSLDELAALIWPDAQS
jgi:hygromycin-B 7''-O-kinase